MAFPKIEFFFKEEAMRVEYFLIFLNIFIVKVRIAINGCESLLTRQRFLSQFDYQPIAVTAISRIFYCSSFFIDIDINNW
jgi:hypothetical protein